jgi:hypothetical protein
MILLLAMSLTAAQATPDHDFNEMARALFVDLPAEVTGPDDFSFLTDDEALGTAWSVYDWTAYDDDVLTYCGDIENENELATPLAQQGWAYRTAAERLEGWATNRINMMELNALTRRAMDISLDDDVEQQLQADFDAAREHFAAEAQFYREASDTIDPLAITAMRASEEPSKDTYNLRERCYSIYGKTKGTLLGSDADAVSRIFALRADMARAGYDDPHIHRFDEEVTNMLGDMPALLPLGSTP